MVENNKKSKIEKLFAEIGRLKKELKKKKKYGLVWEDKPEDVVEMCKEKLPVLKEVKSKEIITDKNKPVNLLIEGDNYHALSVLNYTHAKKIDVIYIDPPYNTGAKDWKYNNDYVDGEDGFRHSKWLSLMSNRLKLSKGLLKESGFFVVAIDHYELFSLGNLCDELFGEENRAGIVTVVHKPEGRQHDKFFTATNEYMIVYAKNKKFAKFNKITIDLELRESFDLEDDHGKYLLKRYLNNDIEERTLRSNKPHFFYPVYVSKNLKDITTDKKGGYIKILPITNKGVEKTWITIKKTFLERVASGEIVALKDEDGKTEIFYKFREQQRYKTHWIDNRYNATSKGTKVVNNIIGEKKFNFPKSLYLIMDILKIVSSKDSIILDYFAGSGTTGHAVLELNKEDDGNRKFILNTDDEGNICSQACYPRIEKVISGYTGIFDKKKYAGLGGNLKYFKTDFVNFKESNDKNKIRMTEEAIEMLCVKEGTFEEIENRVGFKIFKNHDHYMGIIFDQLKIKEFKKAISNIKGKFSVYVFSLGDDTFDEEFEDIKQKVKLSPIPEAILKVYRRIFK